MKSLPRLKTSNIGMAYRDHLVRHFVSGLKSGLTYIMFDVYDKNNKLLPKAHASVRLTVKNGVKPNGES